MFPNAKPTRMEQGDHGPRLVDNESAFHLGAVGKASLTPTTSPQLRAKTQSANVAVAPESTCTPT